MTIRLAVIGAGHLGRIHARLAKTVENAELVSVVDPIEASRNAVAAENQTSACASHHELFGKIDAAILATPTKFHHAVAVDLLKQGVHLLIEKPVTLCAADAEELIQLADKNGCVLQVGHVERFNPAFLAGRHEIEHPRLIDAVRAAPYTFRSTDVSVVLDLMIHDIDLALSLAQSEVRRVDATGGKVFGPNEDWAQARLTFASGAVANLSASRVSPSVQRTMQVTGDNGTLWMDFQAKTARSMRVHHDLRVRGIDVNRLSPTERDAIKAELATKYLPVGELTVTENNAILEEQREFIAATGTGQSVTVDGHAGRDAVAIAERVLAEIARSQASSPRPTILPFLPTSVAPLRPTKKAA